MIEQMLVEFFGPTLCKVGLFVGAIVAFAYGILYLAKQDVFKD